MNDEQSGLVDVKDSHLTTGDELPPTYTTPRLERFGTLTELTLSGTTTGAFETNALTKKYRPKPTS
jgi:hypothetical protein